MYYCIPLLVWSVCACELTFSLKVFSYQCCYMHITHGSLNKRYTQTDDVHTGKKIMCIGGVWVICLFTPQTDLHSWHGCGPCCPARFCGVQECWRRTWPGCTAGPPASQDLSHAPSSVLWPSGLYGFALSGLLHQTEMRCSTRAARTQNQSYT